MFMVTHTYKQDQTCCALNSLGFIQEVQRKCMCVRVCVTWLKCCHMRCMINFCIRKNNFIIPKNAEVTQMSHVTFLWACSLQPTSVKLWLFCYFLNLGWLSYTWGQSQHTWASLHQGQRSWSALGLWEETSLPSKPHIAGIQTQKLFAWADWSNQSLNFFNEWIVSKLCYNPARLFDSICKN